MYVHPSLKEKKISWCRLPSSSNRTVAWLIYEQTRFGGQVFVSRGGEDRRAQAKVLDLTDRQLRVRATLRCVALWRGCRLAGPETNVATATRRSYRWLLDGWLAFFLFPTTTWGLTTFWRVRYGSILSSLQPNQRMLTLLSLKCVLAALSLAVQGLFASQPQVAMP
jgi:hypothetical protein